MIENFLPFTAGFAAGLIVAFIIVVLSIERE